jgi:hypothetical protein
MPSLPPTAPRPSERRLVGRYLVPRPRRLTRDQESEIVRLAATRSLREIAAACGLSHEGVRLILKRYRAESGDRDVG